MSTEGPIQIGSLTIPPAEQTPLVLALLEIIRRQDEEIKALKDEIHKLKGTTQRPKIEPSRLLKPKPSKAKKSQDKRPGSEKRVKTPRGARRLAVLTSVLESLRLQLPDFTLSNVLEEIRRWTTRGRSCFSDLMRKLQLQPPQKSILDALLPLPAD